MTLEDITLAVEELYGGKATLSEESIGFLSAVLSERDLAKLEMQVQNQEVHVREILTEFEKTNSKVVSRQNILQIIDDLLEKEENQ